MKEPGCRRHQNESIDPERLRIEKMSSNQNLRHFDSVTGFAFVEPDRDAEL